MKIPSTLCSGLAAVVLACVSSPVLAAPGDTTVLDYTAGWHAADISADGRFVSFYKATGAGLQPHVLDRSTGAIEPVGDSGHVWQITEEEFILGGTAISDDGRIVAFMTQAWDEEYTRHFALWVSDRTSGTLEKVTESSQTVYEMRPTTTHIALSGDGRYVAFDSEKPGLVPGDDATSDVYVYDRIARLLERVSVSSSEVAGNGPSTWPALSRDGRYVAFMSAASNLAAGDAGTDTAIYVRDRTAGTTERVSPSGSLPAISSDGRFVAFVSGSPDLVPNDTNQAQDVFLRDRSLRVTERVSLAFDGREVAGDSGGPLSLSDDGRFVAFVSYSAGFVLGDTNGISDVFVRDREAGFTERASVRSDGTQWVRNFHNGFYVPQLTADGRYVVFEQRFYSPYGGSSELYLHEVGGRKVWAYQVTPAGASYGNQTLYTTRTRTFTLQNTGTVDLPVAGVELRSDSAEFALVNRCPATLEAGLACAIKVRFRPTSTGTRTAHLKIRVRIGDELTIRTRDLSGTGVVAAFSLTPASLGFGTVLVGSRSTAKRVTVTNTGLDVLPISSMRLAGMNSGQFAFASECPARLARGTSCTVRVFFKPSSKGTKSAMLVVTPGGGAVAKSVSLSGTGG